MKKILLLTLSILFTYMFYSCSDDSTSPSDTTKKSVSNSYFPTSIGSIWSYNYYILDTLGNKVEDSKIILNYVITGTEVKNKKEAFVFQEQDQFGSKLANYYYFTTATTIEEYTDLIPDLAISLPLDWTDQWYVMMNINGTKWEIKKEDIDSLVIPIPNIGNVSLNGTLTLTVEKLADETVNYGANNDIPVNCSKFNLSYSFDGTSKTGFGTFPTTFIVNKYHYYAENIGLVKLVENPFSVDAETILGTLKIKFGGSTKTLLTYTSSE
jgi:hypothetical protein